MSYVDNVSAAKVFTRMLWLTDRELDMVERESIMMGIKECLLNGFTETEAVRYCRNFEEYDPNLSEERALANMARIRADVEKRVGKPYAKR